MAFTISREFSVFGNKKVAFISCSVDSASGNIETGLSVVDAVGVSLVSAATAAYTLKRNLGSNSTAIQGMLNINSATSGDSFFFIAYGR